MMYSAFGVEGVECLGAVRAADVDPIPFAASSGAGEVDAVVAVLAPRPARTC